LPSLEAATGRTDLLRQLSTEGNLDLESLLAAAFDGPRRWQGQRNRRPEDHPPVDEALVQPAIAATLAGDPFECTLQVRNEDRTLGARLAGELALLRCTQPVPQANIRLNLHGNAGQSLGAFAADGMSLVLHGQANDYVGKGLSGGELILRPTGQLAQVQTPHVIMGNVALYGATSGFLFAAGSAGERFAIRNSGATAVVEGLGEHGCEYMTGGMVLVLGPTGRNFGAGMTGGMAYVWDADGTFVAEQKFHPEFVDTKPLADCDSREQTSVRELLQQHVNKTASRLGQQLLAHWPETLPQTLRVASRGSAT
jgi:glutamate synthase (ferredoxin)